VFSDDQGNTMLSFTTISMQDTHSRAQMDDIIMYNALIRKVVPSINWKLFHLQLIPDFSLDL
jgi:hypothetical protein